MKTFIELLHRITPKLSHLQASKLLCLQFLTALLAAFSTLLTVGCNDKENPVYNTSHPDLGAISLSADWSERAEGVNLPSTYTVELNGTTAELDIHSSVIPGLFAPGSASLSAWNTPQGFNITDRKATLALEPGTQGLHTSQADWLFSGSTDITILADDTLHTALTMRQRMRLLRFELTVAEGEYNRIASIYATLSGIATTIDLRTGMPTDATGTAFIALQRTGNKISGEARLPGISAAMQELTVILSYEGNEPLPQTTRSDLSQQLTDFNDGKLSIVTLSGNLRSPISVHAGSTVIDWISGNGEDGEHGSAGM